AAHPSGRYSFGPRDPARCRTRNVLILRSRIRSTVRTVAPSRSRPATVRAPAGVGPDYAGPGDPHRLPPHEAVRELAALAALFAHGRAARATLIADQPM